MNKHDKEDIIKCVRIAIKKERVVDNLSVVLQEIEQKYRDKIGSANLPLDQIAHLLMHLVLKVYEREKPEGSVIKDSVEGGH